MSEGEQCVEEGGEIRALATERPIVNEGYERNPKTGK
jgi:hypothetical protein